MDRIQLRPDFLTDLRAVDPENPILLATPRFLRDLQCVYEAAQAEDTALEAELENLARRVDDWRLSTSNKVRKLIEGLPKDDPIFCPINLFATTECGRLETAHTRALAWLLDPRQQHGFDDQLMKALLASIAPDISEIEVTSVESEKPITLGGERVPSGRLDVFADGHGTRGRRPVPWRLVIEAKVDAAESEEQLDRYDNWLAATNHEVLRVFLTPTGVEPESSTKEKWQPLSFEKLVFVFRESFEKLRETDGFHYLRFYLAGVLKSVCGWPIPITPDCNDPYSALRYLNLFSRRAEEQSHV